MLDPTQPAIVAARQRCRYVVSKRGPRSIDVAVGARVRIARHARALSQEDLGKRLHVTAQQVQKYETGRNRIACSRLIEIADALGVTAPELLADVLGTNDARVTPVDLVLVATCPSARRLVDAIHALRKAGRDAAITDLARIAEQMVGR